MKFSKQALVVLVGGFILTGISFMVVWDYQKRIWENQFYRQVELNLLQFTAKLNTNEEVLFGLSSLFENSNHVSRQEFKESTRALFRRHKFIRALDWAPRVKHSERESFVADVKAEGFPDYKIKEPSEDGDWVPVKEKEEYFPILYREPAEGGEWVLGFDQLSSINAQEVVQQSRSSGEPLATKVFLLKQNEAKIPVTLLFLPSYLKNQSSTDPANINTNLRGFLFGVYNIDQMIDTMILSYLPKGMTLTIYQDQESSENLIYGQRNTNKPLNTQSRQEFFGQSWIIVWQGESYFLNGFNKGYAFLCSGIILLGFFFLAILFQMNFVRNRMVEMEVVKRTEELNLARKEAEKASQAKSQFISAMSHELKTPMNSILGFSQVLKSNKDINKKVKGSIESIHKAGNHLMGLINDILDFSSAEDGVLEVNPIDFDLAGLLGDLSRIYKRQCEKKGLKWDIKGIEDNKHIYVHGDRGKVRRVLANLLSNAVKFTESGSVQMKVEQKSNDDFDFYVTDTGLGIPSDQQETIFDSFHQEEGGFKKGGLGLGLSISKKMIEVMGGKLRVESNINEGSSFLFSLNLPPAHGEVPVFDSELNIQENGGEEVIEHEEEIDFSSIQIPSNILTELKKSVDLGMLDEMETHLIEIDKINPNGKKLAEKLRDLADNFETDEILDILKTFEKN